MKNAILSLALAAALATAACAQTVERSETIVISGTIEAVNADTREVTIAGDGGNSATFEAGSEVQNFDQVEAGDTVTIEYTEAVALAMADPEDDGAPAALVASARAALGEKPGAAAGEMISFVVELVSYDPDTHMATIILPEGDEDTVEVHDAMRAFAAARQPGDRILVVLGQAVAVAVTPAS